MTIWCVKGLPLPANQHGEPADSPRRMGEERRGQDGIQ